MHSINSITCATSALRNDSDEVMPRRGWFWFGNGNCKNNDCNVCSINIDAAHNIIQFFCSLYYNCNAFFIMWLWWIMPPSSLPLVTFKFKPHTTSKSLPLFMRNITWVLFYPASYPHLLLYPRKILNAWPQPWNSTIRLPNEIILQKIHHKIPLTKQCSGRQNQNPKLPAHHPINK